MCSSRQRRIRQPQGAVRSGAATVELSVLLPVLLFLFLAGLDYARVFYASLIVAHCARNGALFASDANVAGRTNFETLEEAVLADASDLSDTLQVSSLEGTDSRGYGWVEVTVMYPFRTVVAYPGIPTQVDITRTVRMRKTGEEE